MNATLAVDYAADAAYLRLNGDEVAETAEVSAAVLVDLNKMRMVVGVEVLTLDAVIPKDELIQEFHMRREDLDVLNTISPTVTSFVQRQGTATVSQPAQQETLVSY